MKLVKRIHELIGETPILEIGSFPLPDGVKIFAKLESFNPGGSVKDRLGEALIRDAIENGMIREGGTLIEPTAGNTGIGLALSAIRYQIKTIFVVPEKFSIEKQQLMSALGAEIIHTPSDQGMAGAIRKADELLQQIPDSFSPRQFANPANPAAYYETLGPEIWKQLDGNIDIFVAGAGTGGTFMGTATYLKERNSSIRTVIVEPEGSILNGGLPAPHRTEGIGMEFLPAFMDTAYFDQIHTISDEEAFRFVRELALREGILAGSSSGAAFAAALKEASSASQGTNIVVVFPDSSERYISKNIYGREEKY